MKKFLLTLVGVVCSLGMWAETVTIGLTQAMNNTDHTMAAAVYSGATNLTVAEAHGTGCGINQSAKKTQCASGYTGTKDNGYDATKTFRKTITSSTWDATEWIGFTVTVPEGKKVTFTNIKAMLADANSGATYTWRVVIANASGTALYTSSQASTSGYNYKSLTVASPTNVAGLAAGTYTVKLQLYQNGGNKYFTIPYLNVDAELAEAISTATPSFTTNLSATYEATVGKETSLAIVASDATGYQWYKCDDASKTNAQAISGATSASYKYTPSAEGDAYFYCVATNSNATGDKTATSNVAKVTAAAATSYAVTWSNTGGWGMRSVTTSSDTNTKLSSGVEVDRGTELIFTSDSGAGWDLTWYVNGVLQSQTTSPLTLTINAATTVESRYVARKKFTFTDNANAKVFADKNGKVKMTANYFSYSAGKTVDYWTNGENKYYVGTEYTLTEDVALTPHFVDNESNLGDATSSIAWKFGYKADNTGCPVFTSLQGSGKTTNYVTQTTINGKSIDVNLVCDPTNGKIDNERRVGSVNTQTNKGTKFTIPVVKGATITIVGAGEFKKSGKIASTIGGSTNYTVTNKTTATYTYNGEESTIDYVLGDDNTYVESITVKYPIQTITASVSEIGYATLFSNQERTIPEGTEVYTGKLDGSSLKLTKLEEVIPAKTAVVIKAEAGDYNFAISATGAAAIANNDLKGVAAETATSTITGGTVCVLGYEDSTVGFYKFTGDKLAQYKAYLVVPEGSGAKGISIVFDDDVTAADEVMAAEAKVEAKKYIKNGKLYIQNTNGTYNAAGAQVK